MTAKTDIQPLSTTVSLVFDRFIQRIKDEKILGEAATKAIDASLRDQNLGHEALRAAIFTEDKAG